jgi:voltage-dependent calcium channel T type alpha-1I
VGHKYFENFILFLIIVSTILLSFQNPLSNPNGEFQQVLDVIDTVMVALFLVECILKIVVLGFIFNGEYSYLRSGWNFIDFLVVAVSLVNLIDLGDGNLDVMRIFRLLRVLRPLRLLSRDPDMRIAVESLLKAIPAIFNLMVIVLLMLGLFSILFTTIYKGLFYTCDFTNIPSLFQPDIATEWECLDYGGEWINSQANFDGFF